MLDARYKYGNVLIGIALLKDYQSSKKTRTSAADAGLDIYKRIKYLSRVVSPILLPMIAGLGEIMEPEITPAYDEE